MNNKSTTSKNFVFSMALILVFTMVNASNKNNNQIIKKPLYSHYLIFWLKSDLTNKEISDFTNFFEGLKKLPYQKNLQYGIPANSTPRSVLDQSYSYSAFMEFDSLEELEAYGKLPEHLELVSKYKKYFDKMVVYDTEYKSK